MYSTGEPSMVALATLTERIRERNATIDSLRVRQDDMILEGVDGIEIAEDRLIDSLAEREQMLKDAKRLHQSIVRKLDLKPQHGGETVRTGTATSASADHQMIYDDLESCDDERRIEILGMSLLNLEQEGPFGPTDIDDESFADCTVDSIGLAKVRLSHVEETVHDTPMKSTGAPVIRNVKNLPQSSPMLQRANTGGRNCAA